MLKSKSFDATVHIVNSQYKPFCNIDSQKKFVNHSNTVFPNEP